VRASVPIDERLGIQRSLVTTGPLDQGRREVDGQGVTDDESFDAFARELIPDLIRAVRRLAPAGADVEAIASEALARAYARWGRLVNADYRAAWVYRVAVNLAHDAGRRAARTTRLASTRPTPEAFDDAADERMDLRAALADLSTRQREALVLRYVVDLPLEEIGQAMSIAPATVRKHLDRALSSLRSALGPQAEEAIHERP